jgi:hypothetical protein
MPSTNATGAEMNGKRDKTARRKKIILPKLMSLPIIIL